MKKIGLIAAIGAAVLMVAQPALAQQAIGASVRTTAPTYISGETRPLSMTTSGELRVTSSASGASSQQVQGNSASGAADVGNPVKIGCVYLATLPNVANGQRVDCQSDPFGSQRTRITTGIVAGVDGLSNSNMGAMLYSGSSSAETYLGVMPFYFNGTSWDRQRTVTGALTTGAGTAGVALSPHTAAAGAIVPTASSAVTAGQVLKASAGNLYEWRVTSGASAGYVLIFNSATVPADGAVTPLDCIALAANATVGSGSNIPERYTAGITIVFSTTGCFTKTGSATAFIRGRVV